MKKGIRPARTTASEFVVFGGVAVALLAGTLLMVARQFGASIHPTSLEGVMRLGFTGFFVASVVDVITTLARDVASDVSAGIKSSAPYVRLLGTAIVTFLVALSCSVMMRSFFNGFSIHVVTIGDDGLKAEFVKAIGFLLWAAVTSQVGALVLLFVDGAANPIPSGIQRARQFLWQTKE